MKSKTRSSAKVLRELIEYLTFCLEDLSAMESVSQFTEGEITAFVDCLEVVSKWTGYRKKDVENIEQRFLLK